MDIEAIRALLAQLGQQQQQPQGAPPSMGMGMPPPPMPMGMPPSDGMNPGMDSAGLLPDSKPLGGFSPANGMDPSLDGDMDNAMPTDQSFEEILQMLNARAMPPMPMP